MRALDEAKLLEVSNPKYGAMELPYKSFTSFKHVPSDIVDRKLRGMRIQIGLSSGSAE